MKSYDFESCSWLGVLDISLCISNLQKNFLFCLRTLVSATNKTDHPVTLILAQGYAASLMWIEG
jgi:hypothetical protein